MTAPVLQAFYACGRCIKPEDTPFLIGTTTLYGVCTRCGGQAAWMLDARINEPRLGHHGVTPVCSTNCSMVPYYIVKWDTNGYYRELGVSPYATHGQIAKAYLNLGNNPTARQTYCVKQLLNKKIRAAYDATPLGSLFVDDYLIEAALRRAKDEAARAVREGYADSEEDTVPITAEELADAFGTTIDALDTGRRRVHDDRPTQPWGFYLWRSFSNDHDRLSEWRGALVSAFWKKGVIANIAVGYLKGMESWVVAQVGSATVFFINEDAVPTEAMAEAAADYHINSGV